MEYRIEQLAQAARVAVDTIRFYQGKGLLDSRTSCEGVTITCCPPRTPPPTGSPSSTSVSTATSKRPNSGSNPVGAMSVPLLRGGNGGVGTEKVGWKILR